jgi:hypothetical protein
VGCGCHPAWSVWKPTPTQRWTRRTLCVLRSTHPTPLGTRQTTVDGVDPVEGATSAPHRRPNEPHTRTCDTNNAGSGRDNGRGMPRPYEYHKRKRDGNGFWRWEQPKTGHNKAPGILTARTLTQTPEFLCLPRPSTCGLGSRPTLPLRLLALRCCSGTWGSIEVTARKTGLSTPRHT